MNKILFVKFIKNMIKNIRNFKYKNWLYIMVDLMGELGDEDEEVVFVDIF